MTAIVRRLSTATVLLSLAMLQPHKAAAQPCHPSGDEPLITVVALKGSANRAGNTPFDVFVTRQGQQFGAARSYTSDALGKLALTDIDIVLPLDEQRHTYSGPLLETLLSEAGATGRGVAVRALDGYEIEFTAADLARLHPILALCRDGQRLGIADLGPGYLLYKPRVGEQPTDEERARMVMSVYFLRPL